MSRRHSHRPDEPDTQASVQAYFTTLPRQDKETYEALHEIAELGASFKDAAASLLERLGEETPGLEAATDVELVEVEGGPDGPRYTAVARFAETALIFRGHVFRDDERGRESVVLSLAYDEEELGGAEVEWPLSHVYAGGEVWHYRSEDGDWQRRPDELVESYAVAHSLLEPGPPLSLLEEPLDATHAARLPSVADLESWPVLEPGLAPDEPLRPGS